MQSLHSMTSFPFLVISKIMCTLLKMRFLCVLAVIGLTTVNYVCALPTNVDVNRNPWILGANSSNTSPSSNNSSSSNEHKDDSSGPGMPIWLILLLVLLILVGIGMVIFVVCLFREDKEKDKKSHSKKKKRSSSKHSVNKKGSVHSKKTSKK